MTPIIHFVAGLPRSGSTLLQNLLAQNPRHHVTPTNDLIQMMMAVRNNWTNFEGFKAQGIQNVQPRVAASLRAMSYGFYERELSAGQVVFDKSRGWLQHIELLEEVYRRPIRVICTVRDMKAVAASFEKLHRANALARRQYLGPAYFQAQTIDGRARVLTSPGGVIGLPVNWIRDALNRGVADRVIVVRYQDLTSQPQATLDWLHDQLGSPRFQYDPENVEQVTMEDDSSYGWGPDLHRIRREVRPPDRAPWEDVLPPHTCEYIDQTFPDIQGLVYSSPLSPPDPREAVRFGAEGAESLILSSAPLITFEDRLMEILEVPVKELRKRVSSGEIDRHLDYLLKAEQAGQNRKGAIKALERRISQIPMSQ